jgi:hypothetical protein
MSLIQLLLLSHKLQCMIITIQDKLLRNLVMSPFLQCLDNSIELLVIRGLFHFFFIQLLVEVCYQPIFLAQDCPYFKSTCITFYLKCLFEIRQQQNWLFHDFPFQQIESFLSLFHPVKIFVSLIHYFHHRCTNSTENPDELLVETSQSMKTSNFKDIFC